MPLPLELPTLQNWSCHNCGGCCRQHAIEITPTELRRIESQQWQSADSPLRGQVLWRRLLPWWINWWPLNRLIHRLPPPWWFHRGARLAHQPDGSCVFLDAQGLCRIHGKFGEPAKPLACRLYPYAFHPSGKKIAVSLRFSCPSVVRNLGRPLAEQTGDLRELESLVVPDGAERIAAPLISPRQQLSWTDTLRVVRWLVSVLEPVGVPFPIRMIRLLFVANLLGKSKFEKISGERVDELLSLLVEAAPLECPTDPRSIPEPSSPARQMFRMLCAQYARKDTAAQSQSGLWQRWKLLRAATAFARGLGNVPPLQAGFSALPFASLEIPCGDLPTAADEMLTRYVRVKLQGLHFFGRAYYDIPLADGLQALGLAVAAILWMARWRARSQGRDRWESEDFVFAITVVDHQHAYTPVLGQYGSRARTRLLAQLDEISKLLAWYARGA